MFLGQRVVLTKAKTGTRMGDGGEQKAPYRDGVHGGTYLSWRGSQDGTPTHSVCSPDCVPLPFSCPFKTPLWALPLPGPAAPPQPCTLETRGTGVSATQ